MTRPAPDPSAQAPAVPGSGAPRAPPLEELIGEMMLFLHAAARDEDLTLLQVIALRLLQGKGPLSPSQIAIQLGISRPAATSFINNLEAGGWIQRVRPTGDRRRLLTCLTPRARRTLLRLAGRRRQFLAKGLARLSPADRSRFLRLARILVGHLRAETQGGRRPLRPGGVR
ncbi:MAG TPA: MarR family transcriptional regulator [Thermoplasmata archaeon]|nr:MarR family transcriptional regulator [Thermoplasmata archaeon]